MTKQQSGVLEDDGPATDYPGSEDLHSQVHDNAKRSISLRIHTTDYGKIRLIARRLRVRDSDVFRFLLRVALARLAPLYTDRGRGRDLMPILLEFGTELARHFGMDARRLEMAVNAGVSDPDERVDLRDIELLTMTGLPDRAVLKRLQDTLKQELDPFTLNETLRDYLYQKYVGPESDGKHTQAD